MGFEPTALCLGRRCSTPELRPLATEDSCYPRHFDVARCRLYRPEVFRRMEVVVEVGDGHRAQWLRRLPGKQSGTTLLENSGRQVAFHLPSVVWTMQVRFLHTTALAHDT